MTQQQHQSGNAPTNFTPRTGRVRDRYIENKRSYRPDVPVDEAGAEFDRWLAQVIQMTQAKTLDHVADGFTNNQWVQTVDEVGWVNVRGHLLGLADAARNGR